MDKETKEAIKLAIECVETAYYTDKLESVEGDYNRNPPFYIDEPKYKRALEYLKDLLKGD